MGHLIISEPIFAALIWGALGLAGLGGLLLLGLLAKDIRSKSTW